MLKNQTSKSVILAPFNSTKSNLDMSQPTLTPSMRELLVSKRCLKFAARVRDVDKQYEMNNNADLDNGVYHKVENEEEKKEDDNKDQPLKTHHSSDDSLKGSFNKETIRSEEDEESQRIQKEKKKKEKSKKGQAKEKQTELEKLESLIC